MVVVFLIWVFLEFLLELVLSSVILEGLVCFVDVGFVVGEVVLFLGELCLVRSEVFLGES